MADDIERRIESAFDMLINVTEESKNLRHDLKDNITSAVSILRKAMSTVMEHKDKEIKKLQDELTKSQSRHLNGKHGRIASQMTLAAPSVERSGRSSEHAQEEESLTSQGRSYAAVAGGVTTANTKSFKLIVKSKNNQSTEYMKTLLKTKVNPVEIKVGVNSLKTLRNGQLLIESNKKEDADIICTNINEKCGGELEATVSKKRNPRIIIFNIPEEITLENAVQALTTQNQGLEKFENQIQTKFAFEDKRKNKNLILEVCSAARREILGRKLKLGWNMCNWDDYVKVGRCFKSCKYKHRAIVAEVNKLVLIARKTTLKRSVKAKKKILNALTASIIINTTKIIQ